MADVQTTDINTKPTVTAIDSNDQIYISDGGTALKKISYTNLAKAIIEQYNASQLAGATKTIQTAFNELNSNFAGSISKAVNSWTDAIEAAKNANYRIVSVRINGTDSQNLPTGFNVHWGTIYCNPGGTYGAAILQSFSGDIYTKGLSAGTWTDWQKQPTRAEVDTLNSNLTRTRVPDNTDFNTLVADSSAKNKYYMGTNISAMVHKPELETNVFPFALDAIYVDGYVKQVLHVYTATGTVKTYERIQWYNSGNKSFSEWQRRPERAEVDALNTYLSTPRVEFKGLQNDETVNSGSITVTKAGLYLVKFELAHCGANSITNVGAYWNVDLRNSSDGIISQYNQVRATIAIPLAKVWDFEVNAIGIYNLSAGGTYHAKFQNKSGIATDSGYNSAVGLFMKYLGTV